MVSCSVANCEVTRCYNPNNYSFHRFPANTILRKKWIRILNRDGWSPKKNSLICSKHFESKYFIQRKHRRFLMKDSIPTLFVPVQLKSRRLCSYMYRDISPPPVVPLPAPSSEVLSLREKKLIEKCSKLKRIILNKNKLLRNIKAKARRMRIRLLDLEAVVKQLNIRPEIKDHDYIIIMDAKN